MCTHLACKLACSLACQKPCIDQMDACGFYLQVGLGSHRHAMAARVQISVRPPKPEDPPLQRLAAR